MKILLWLSGGIDLGYNKPGLGPNRFGWLRILLPFQKRFYNAACHHDIQGYSVGRNEDDRYIADKLFLCDMVDKCETLYQREWAGRYYRAVRKFGRFFFTYKITYKLEK